MGLQVVTQIYFPGTGFLIIFVFLVLKYGVGVREGKRVTNRILAAAKAGRFHDYLSSCVPFLGSGFFQEEALTA